MTRICVEEPCEHGYIESHYWHPRKKIALSGVPDNHYCPGGSRRVLTEGEYLLVEKVDGEWPEANREPIMEMLHEKDDPIPDDAYQLADTGLWARNVGYRIVAVPPDALADQGET